jgi:hypothetical protein
MKHISIVNDIKNMSSPNAVNSRGRKLCPITFDVLTTNNTINIDGVLYSTKGFSKWVCSELARDYDRLVALCEMSYLFQEKTFFVKYLHIRSPMTNLPYDIPTLTIIYDVFLWKYYVLPIYCIYDFIKKYKGSEIQI